MRGRYIYLYSQKRYQKISVYSPFNEERKLISALFSVMPWSTKDLAPSIWHKLYLDSLRPEMKSEAYSRYTLFKVYWLLYEGAVFSQI